MIIHQFVAYALYVTPVFFMWEKLVRTHTKSYWVKLPSRIPVCESLFLLVALPMAVCHVLLLHFAHASHPPHFLHCCLGECCIDSTGLCVLDMLTWRYASIDLEVCVGSRKC